MNIQIDAPARRQGAPGSTSSFFLVWQVVCRRRSLFWPLTAKETTTKGTTRSPPTPGIVPACRAGLPCNLALQPPCNLHANLASRHPLHASTVTPMEICSLRPKAFAQGADDGPRCGETRRRGARHARDRRSKSRLLRRSLRLPRSSCGRRGRTLPRVTNFDSSVRWKRIRPRE